MADFYTYDAAGNRTVQNSSVNGTRTTYVYDAADQLTSSDASTSSSRTVTTFTYDASGNLATEKENGTVTVTNTWDDENRRTKLQMVSGGPGDYAYNADGQRVLKTISGAQTRLVWDGEAYLMELDGSNVTNAVYTVAPGAFGMLLAQRRKSGAVWTPSHYLFDALGSTDRLLSAAQAVTDSYVYKAFGEIAGSTGSTANPFRFVGRYGYYYYGWSVGSDLYVRARWYKPVQARWLSIDPLGFAAGDYNLFRYVGNRVVLVIDPSGKVDNIHYFDRPKRRPMPHEEHCPSGPNDPPKQDVPLPPDWPGRNRRPPPQGQPPGGPTRETSDPGLPPRCPTSNREECKWIFQRVIDEANRRRDNAQPGGESSVQHCWAACEFGRIGGLGGGVGPLGLPTAFCAGTLAAIISDFAEWWDPSSDWYSDIVQQHKGAECGQLVVMTFGYITCDECCRSCPRR